MHRYAISLMLLLLVALPAQAADTNKYPDTLIDQTCTDSFDVPTAYDASISPTVLGATGATIYPAALVQLSGSGDGFCDNDSRIITGAITADTTFGPFSLPKGSQGIFLFVDRDTVTGGTINWQIHAKQPHDGVNQILVLTVADASTGDVFYQFGGSSTRAAEAAGAADEMLFPAVYYVFYNEITATSMTVEMSQVPFF